MRHIMILVAILTLISCCCSNKTTPAKPKEIAKVEELPEPSFGIIFMGDTGTGDQDQKDVSKAIETFCKLNKCSLGLLLGDNFYPKGVSNKDDPQFKTKFEDVYKELTFRFLVVVGNHDKYGNKQAEADYKSAHWEMGGLFYSVDAEWIDFYAIDSNPNGFQGPFKGREQRTWLSQALPKSLANWKIVFGHHPVYSSGFHGDTILLKHYLEPMLKENKVDFYLSGHDHDKELIERDGIKYVVSGAGAKTRPVNKGKYTVFSKSSRGFGYLLLKQDTAIIKFIDSQGAVEFERAYKKDISHGKKTTSSP